MKKSKVGKLERKYLNEELVGNIGTDYTLSESETAPFVVTYLNSERSYLIDENGNVSEYVDISKDVKIGDYVAYDPTVSDKNGTPVDSNKLTYTSPTGTATVHGNGYTSGETSSEGSGGQKFTATRNTKWKILEIGTETVTLISDELIKKDKVSENSGNFVMQGAIGYLYAEQELNEICKIFGYGYGADTSQVTKYSYGGPKDGELTGEITGSGARSITVEDINKKAGITESDYTTLNSNYGDTTNPTMQLYYPTINNNSAKEKSNSENGEKIKYAFYSYSKSEIKDMDVCSMLFNGCYWFASRCAYANSNDSYFDVRQTDSGGVNACYLSRGLSSDLSEREVTFCAVRPIVILKSNVIDINTDYVSENKWKLK